MTIIKRINKQVWEFCMGNIKIGYEVYLGKIGCRKLGLTCWE